MKLSKIEDYVAQLLLMEGGLAPANAEYMELLTVFEQQREHAFHEAELTANGTEPTLFGLSLSDARCLWRDYYGARDVEKMDATCLRRMTFTDWLLALQRRCWFPLNCDKLPYQHLSNMVADSIRFYADAPLVLSQLLDFLEENRRFFAKTFEPLPPAEVINNQITRRLYCQVRSPAVCNQLVRQLADHRIQYINQRAATDGLWAQHADALILRTERMVTANSY